MIIIKKQIGFTLVELLVVIAIIGLLSTFAIVAFNGARAKARDAQRVADIKQIQTALELYRSYEDTYPSASGTVPPTFITSPLVGANSSVTFMKVVPSNPTPADTVVTGCGGQFYTYTQEESGSSYTLLFCLGAKTGSLGSGLHKVTPNGF